ncbi:MAG: hypothetical protein ACREFU_13125 [Acetobacteraceae bacterium]
MPSRAKKLERDVARQPSIPKELVEHFLTGPMSGEAINAIGRGAIAYPLRRLHLHGMIERLLHGHRYRVTNRGWRPALSSSRTYNRLLRPGLAAVRPGHASQITPLRRALDTLDKRIHQSLAQQNLAG